MSRKAVRAIVRRGDKLLVMQRDKFGSRYYTLVGGGIKVDEEPPEALAREIMEETSMKLTKSTPAFKEHAGDPYGAQYVFVCEVEGDEPKLAPDSEEAQINELGQNIHTPIWVSIDEFKELPFRSERLKQAILDGIANGFPAKPIPL
jgi:8-oxo-dGTP diphosphatase